MYVVGLVGGLLSSYELRFATLAGNEGRGGGRCVQRTLIACIFRCNADRLRTVWVLAGSPAVTQANGTNSRLLAWRGRGACSVGREDGSAQFYCTTWIPVPVPAVDTTPVLVRYQ